MPKNLTVLKCLRLFVLPTLFFLTNTSQAQVPVITADPVSQTVCAYDTARFIISASNYTSVIWQYSLDAMNWTTITNSSTQQSSTTPYFTYSTLLLVGTNFNFVNTVYYYRCIAINGSGNSIPSAVASLTVNESMPSADPGAPVHICTQKFLLDIYNSTNYLINIDHANCYLIDSLYPSGANPLVEYVKVTSCVTIDSTVQSYNGVPYVQRHYNIDPQMYGETATATVTLYFTQQDFDNYNAARGSLPALPTGPSDATGISNVRIVQFHGTGTAPGTYVGTSGDIDPDDNNIVWNPGANRWEITFNINGFSGFFVSTGSLVPLPLTLLSFTGSATNNSNLLKWTTTSEVNVSHFEIERSVDGDHFNAIGKKEATNKSDLFNNYTFDDVFNGGSDQVYFYRLNMIDLDGKNAFSKIIVIQPFSSNLFLQVSPNPFNQQISISATIPVDGNVDIILADISGRKILKQTKYLKKGTTNFYLNNIHDLQKGIYILNFSTNNGNRIIKLLKQE